MKNVTSSAIFRASRRCGSQGVQYDIEMAGFNDLKLHLNYQASLKRVTPKQLSQALGIHITSVGKKDRGG
eukprot:m.44367 g.44367  ORF g.44367 m.44367 type:complete len:70 (-) comp13007_c1_seq4:1173-1382(-)